MSLSFRNDIQGLRAIAFLTVFLFHINPSFLSGGFIGVDIFFVISGFLMTAIVVNQKEKNQFSFVEFYKKRLFRIIPPLYLMTLIVLVIGFFLILPHDVLTIRSSAVSSLIFYSNNFFLDQGDYFGAKLSENPFLHTWSLAVEVQFYLLIPFILYFVPKRFLKMVFIVTSVIILGFVTYKQTQEINLYYSTFARIPEFFIGSLAFLVGNYRSVILKNTLSAVGILVILLASIFYSNFTVFPGLSAIVVCLATMCILCSGGSVVNQWISNKLFVHIGQLSYSLYLWHWPILALVRYANDSAPFEVFDYCFVVILTYFVSFFSYHLIERRLANLFFKLKLVTSASVLLVICVGSYFSYHFFQIKEDEIFRKLTRPNFGIKSHNTTMLEHLGSQADTTCRVLLIGDSHALTSKLMFDRIAKRKGFRFQAISSDVYPPLELIKFLDKSDYDFKMYYYEKSLECAQSFPSILSRYKIIIFQMSDYNSHKLIIPLEVMNELKDNQILILVNSYPTLDRNPIRLNKGYTNKSNYNFKIKEPKLPKELIHIVEQKVNVYILDLSKSNVLRNVYFKGISMYYDSGHINNLGASKLAEEFEDEFNDIWFKINSKNTIKQNLAIEF